MAAEAVLQARILKYLEGQTDVWHTKIHSAGMGRRGVPDILACVAGTFVAIECKAPSGYLSADQLREIDKINDAAGVTLVAYTLEDVIGVVHAVREIAMVRCSDQAVYQHHVIQADAIELIP